MNNQEYKIDIGVGVVSFVLGVVAFVLALDMPGRASMFPKFVGVLFCILGAVLAINNAIKLIKGAESTKTPIDFKVFKSPFMVFALLIVYVFVMKTVGFYVTTPFMLIIYMRLMGVKSWRTTIISTLVVMLFVFGLFTFALDIPLPEGFLI